MKTQPAYLIVDADPDRGRARIVRVTQRWPQLYPGEIIVRISLEIPDDLLPNVQEIEITDPDYVAIAVEGEALEIPAQ